jgi:transposase-like protein
VGGRPRVDGTPEEVWQIVQEGIKGGNVLETCRRHGISPSLFPHVRRALRPDKLPGAVQVSRSKGPTLCWRKGWGTRQTQILRFVDEPIRHG